MFARKANNILPARLLCNKNFPVTGHNDNPLPSYNPEWCFTFLGSSFHNIKQLRVRTYSFPVLTRSYYFVQTRFNISIYFNISFVVVSGSSCSFINPTNVNSSIFESLSTSKVGYNLVVSAFSKIE